MPTILTLPGDRLERANVPERDGRGVRAVQAAFETPREGAPRGDDGGPDEPGISLCERERRWVCEWWPPD
jgi:hypothetical protein